MLNNGDRFPALRLKTVGGGETSLPDDLAGSFGVVLTYRGAWCPLCNDQLAGFQAATAELDALNVKVVAFSVDDEATSAALADKLHLSFPLGYGADADEVAAALGAFTNPEPHYLQPSGFILAPDGTVMNAVYASNAMGRLTADEVTRLVKFVNARRAAA